MNAEHTCEQCGAALPADAPKGVCPACLLKLGMVPGSDDNFDQGEDDTTVIVADASAPSKQTKQPSAASAQTPQPFGDYEILDELGRGGMGVIYRARQRGLDRVVALKMILSGELAGEIEIKRFHAEAEAAAQLQHPNIVAIHEVGEHDGRPFFSMDYVEGDDLAERCRLHPLSPEQAARYLQTIAQAIAYAHKSGILHRDLKPSNVLIDGQDEPRITDFGLARKLDSESQLTQTGTAMGSPGYMPPEQAEGRTADIGTHSDIYSLGALLCHLLTGRPPFQAATPLETMRQVSEDEPVSPRQVNPNVPLDLETLCLKCLDKEPARRYRTAEDLAEDLGRFLRHEPIQARRIGRLERARKWARRKPAAAALILVSIAAVVLLIAGLSFHISQLRERYFESLIDQARTERVVNRRQESLELITRAAEIKRDAIVRSEAIESIARPGMTLAHTLPILKCQSAQFSRDGTMLATAGEKFEGRSRYRSVVRVWELETGQLIAETDWNPLGGGIAFSPDSSCIVVPTQSGGAQLWDPRSQRVRAVLPAQGAFLFSPDGTTIAVANKRMTQVFHAADGQLIAEGEHGSAVAFPNNDSLLLRADQAILRWRFENNELLPVTPAGSAASFVSANGARVLLERMTTNGLGRLSVFDIQHQTELFESPIVGTNTPMARWSHDGAFLALADSQEPESLRIYEVATGAFRRAATRRGVVNLYPRSIFDTSRKNSGGAKAPNPDIYSGLAPYTGEFSPDGMLFALQAQSGEQDCVIWDVATGEQIARLDVLAPVWSPDSRHLASVSSGSALFAAGRVGGGQAVVKVWHSARGVVVRRLPHEVDSLAFSPDGSRLAVNGALWDLKPSIRTRPAEGDIRHVIFLADGQVWGTDNPAGARNLWQLEPRKRHIAFRGHGAVAFSPDGSRLFKAHYASVKKGNRVLDYVEAQFQEWNLETEKMVRSWSPASHERKPFGALAVSADGQRLASSVYAMKGLDIWELTSQPSATRALIKRPGWGEMARNIFNGLVRGGTTPNYRESLVNFIFLTPDGERVISSSRNRIIIRRAADGKVLHQCIGHDEQIRSLALRADGRVIASGDKGGRLHLWDAQSGKELARWQAHDSTVSAVALSAGGATLATGGGQGLLKLWDLAFIRSELRKLGLDWQLDE